MNIILLRSVFKGDAYEQIPELLDQLFIEGCMVTKDSGRLCVHRTLEKGHGRIEKRTYFYPVVRLPLLQVGVGPPYSASVGVDLLHELCQRMKIVFLYT